MVSFENKKLNELSLKMNIVTKLTTVSEYKGKQGLYKHSPQILNSLLKLCIENSALSSFRLEGISISNERLNEIIYHNFTLRDKNEKEIGGYIRALRIIHSTYNDIQLNSSFLLELHKNLYIFTYEKGGYYKNNDLIDANSFDVNDALLIKPISYSNISNYIEKLCEEFTNEIEKKEIHPLILIAAFILDFLHIQPFEKGNRRMSRLLIILLLYKSGFEIGKFISLEEIIEYNKESYYKVLSDSITPSKYDDNKFCMWIDYLLTIIIKAYNELDNEAEFIENLNKSNCEKIEYAINSVEGYFSKTQINDLYPYIDKHTVKKVFEELKKEGIIEPVIKGRSSKWRRV